jgi:hypothetical protein
MLSNVFYHGYEYFADDNIHTLALQEKYTLLLGLFLFVLGLS